MAFDFKAIQKTFFTSDAVLRAMDRKTKAALSKMGAFIRQRAKSSIRKRKKPSAPGMPPSSHVGTLKKLIFFGYDSAKQSVVAGPVPFGKGIAPHALEYGGPSVVIRSHGKTNDGKRLKTIRPIVVKPRPFMQPAMLAELPKFAPLFRE